MSGQGVVRGSRLRPHRITFWVDYHPVGWTGYGVTEAPVHYKFVAIGVIKARKGKERDEFRVHMWETEAALPHSAASQKGVSRGALLKAAMQELTRASNMEVKGLSMSNLSASDGAA